ncbi:branched-chain amino acid ABC transporter permease [Sulfitobacter pacificus]|uniref:Branched-chain amino acid ABC transporter permease n=1 Tax=Sulfitobacter pacificus TaxID=1499314 RepID=A0ABQ5VQI7_9RHOB|nr:branched-chain amino acid ABC transporter permease [Sulfitobacter pacificus]GLQ29199.1 branched-chain amino acid ABC transporter permease [Sulfitobacter pacificus]
MTETKTNTEELAVPSNRTLKSVGGINTQFAVALLLMVIIVAPWVAYPIFVMKVMCFGLFAAAFNLLIGQVGLLSFGHAAFFGGASYVTAYTLKTWDLTPELAVLTGTAFAGLSGLVMGWVAIRRQGIYFAMVTLAIAQMFYFFCVQFSATGGENGIQAVPRGNAFSLIDLTQPAALYAFVSSVFVIGLAIIWRVVNSPFGATLAAIRDNEDRAISLGYRTSRYKLGAFVISAALAGLAGATKAVVFQVAALTDVAWHMSGEVILMTLVGGIGTFFGPVVGALVIVALQNYIAGYAIPISVVTGTIFVACVLVFRRGIIGEMLYRIGNNRKN